MENLHPMTDAPYTLALSFAPHLCGLEIYLENEYKRNSQCWKGGTTSWFRKRSTGLSFIFWLKNLVSSILNYNDPQAVTALLNVYTPRKTLWPSADTRHTRFLQSTLISTIISIWRASVACRDTYPSFINFLSDYDWLCNTDRRLHKITQRKYYSFLLHHRWNQFNILHRADLFF